MGTQQWGLFFALTFFENGLQLVGLFCFFASNPQISTLRWMRFVGCAVTFVVMIGFLLGNQKIRRVYFPQGLFTRSAASTLASVERRDARLLVRQGLSAVASDLSVQLSMTAGTIAFLAVASVGSSVSVHRHLCFLHGQIQNQHFGLRDDDNREKHRTRSISCRFSSTSVHSVFVPASSRQGG